MMRAGAHLRTTGIWRKAIRIWSDRRGIAAVEFALIMPILLIMYFVTMEASQAIETSKKVSRIGSMVADLVTQQPTVDKANLDAIMKIGTSTLQPYNRSTRKSPSRRYRSPTDVTTAEGKGGVVAQAGQWCLSAGLPPSTVPPRPSRRRSRSPAPSSFASTADLAYKPIITWSADSEKRLGLSSAFNTISMGETYYLRPRRSVTIPCRDC